MSKPRKKQVTKVPGKWTMKEPYTKTRFWSKQTRGVFDLFRPFTLAAPFIVSMSIMVASLVYNFKMGFLTSIPEDWWITVGQAGFTIAIINAASNALNQATDVESDKISKPYRPIPRGVVKKEGAQSLAYILYLFALLRAVTINYWFGIFVFLIMVFTVMYSLPPRMKKYLFINQLWIAIPRGMFGIMAAWSVFIPDDTHPFQLTLTPLIIGAVATAYLLGGMSTKDITDAEADKVTGTKTLINTIGIKQTALICFPFMLFPFLFIPMFTYAGMLDSHLWVLSLFAILSIFVFYLMIRSSESKTLENVKAWSVMYVEYIFFALCFSVLTIFSEYFTFLKIF
jgi:geranylgeranylglycerol-phosphate geranylgeranyltransferase